MSARSEVNARVRATVHTRFPQTTFAVRNGQQGRCQVTWTDGPTLAQVRDHLAGLNLPWPGERLEREVSPHLVAVAFWRERANGNLYAYQELLADDTTIPVGSHPLDRAGPHWRMDAAWEQVDATTITSGEDTAARVALVLLGGPKPTDPQTDFHRRRSIAAFIAAQYETLTALLTN